MSRSQIVAVVLGIVIIAGGVILHYRNENTNSIEKIFSKVSNAISSQKFIRQKIDGSSIIKDEKLTTQNNLPAGIYPKINFSFDMIAPSVNWTNPSGDTKASANMKLYFDNLAKDPVSIEADFIMLKLIYYVKLNELTGVPVDFSSVKNKWWKVDIEALAKNFAGMNADKILESAKANQLSKEKMEQLETIAKKYENAIHIEELADGEIEGAVAYRWNVVLNKTQLANMLLEFLDVFPNNSKDVQKVKISDVETVLKLIDIKSIELLVQKNDYLPAQIKFSVDILDKSRKNIGTVDMSMITSGSDPVEIKAPAESTDIMYLMANLMTSMSKSGRIPSPSVKLK